MMYGVWCMVYGLDMFSNTLAIMCVVNSLYGSNLEGLCRTAYLHLQRVAKERDGHFDVSGLLH